MSTFRVAIDGPAGAGKSSIAKKVADALDMLYIDTGAMYRAVTYGLLRSGIDPQDSAQVEQFLRKMNLVIQKEGHRERVLLNGEDVTEVIRTPRVTATVSKVASQPLVRDALVKLQRQYGAEQDVVMDGRDIATQVFPDAQVKIFLTASLEERARRRYRELLAKGEKVTYEEVYSQIAARDHVDQNRSIAPLAPAHDAVILDTSNLSIEEVVQKVIEMIEQSRQGSP